MAHQSLPFLDLCGWQYRGGLLPARHAKAWVYWNNDSFFSLFTEQKLFFQNANSKTQNLFFWLTNYIFYAVLPLD